MADNYLERKMEELHSGKFHKTSGIINDRNRRPTLTYPYRALRILIVSNGRTFLRQYADTFLKYQGRIAVFNTEDISTTDFTENSGVRYYHISDGYNVNDAMDNLIDAWRDIDLIILLDGIEGFDERLQQHLRQLPYPNDWGMPVLIPSPGKVSRRNWETYLSEKWKPLPDSPLHPEAAVMPWLALNSNSNISAIILQP